MDESQLSNLKKCTRKVVHKASQPGGMLEKDEFTMAVARRLITAAMGLAEGSLDGKEWKKVVKDEVTAALAEPEPPISKSKPKSKSKPEPKATAKPESKTTAKPESTIKEKKAEKSGSSPETKIDAGDESDMSSVYDAPPKRKSKSSESSKPQEKKDVDEGLSPDETRIAELKRIVVACGVRKQWSKEFVDCPSASSQIRHLESILTELGMKGTPTIGKAKSLKEKRELAAELDEVQEFEAKRGVSDPPEERASRSRDPRKRASNEDNEEEEADEEERYQVRDKKASALSSVLDFLGDQSDSD